MVLINKLRAFRIVRDTRGLSTVEYVILLALIAAFAVFSWNQFGGKVKGYLDGSAGEIDDNMHGFAKE